MSEVATVVVTGTGAVSAAGRGRAALWSYAEAGLDALRPLIRIAGPELAGQVPGWDDVRLEGSGGAAAQSLCVAFGELAAREALAAAGLTPTHRVALVFGSNLFDRPAGLDALACRIAQAVGVGGPCLAVSTACASSASAIAIAGDLLRGGTLDAVLAGGADVLTPLVFAGFRVLGLLAPDRCAPFSLPVGMSLGEGAAFLVLERSTAARARGATVTTALAGAGLAGDAFHPTSPDPRGEAIFRSITRALRRASLSPSAIAYVNSHGTGTESGDIAECHGLVRALGDRPPPISASKSIFGHAQGAAGALEAVLTLEGRARELAPPTLRHVGARPGCPLDAIAEGRPRALHGDAVLTVNSGFGGAAAALVFATPGPAGLPEIRRPVWLRAVREARLGPEPTRRHPAADALTAAVADALAIAELPIGDVNAGARRGLYSVQAEVSPAVVRTTEVAIHRRGLERVPATLFGRALLISATGACAAALDLRGPVCAFAGAAGTTATALALAGEQLARGDDVTGMAVAAVVESDDTAAHAYCVVLADTPDLDCPIELAGWAVTAADADDEANRAALAAAGCVAADLVLAVQGRCCEALEILAAAVAALQAGWAGRALITAIEPGHSCCALVLARRTDERTDS